MQKLKVETQIRLNKFKPREYQLGICRALENKGIKRILAVWPRRSGKDITAFNLMIRSALKKVAVYYYIFPTYAQGKKVIWDSITNSGQRFLDYIPEELVASKNGQEMKITLTNGSIIQVVGSDNVNSLVGTNPYGCIFSEYALQDPRAYQFLRPILLVNDGWAIFVSTPRSKNNLWELYNIAKQSPEWFCERLTVDDTGHLTHEQIQKERVEGLMSEDLIQQEYFCSFDRGVEGSYYSRYLDRMRLNGQITIVPWEYSAKVHTAWDLGMRDSTTIIFFQVIGQVVRVIDYYENNSQGLDHYAKILQQKPYLYGKHIAPHDIKVRELGTGMSRLEKARQLGISFTVAPNLSLEDGIEAVRATMAKVWIDEKNCVPLINALESYRREYDEKMKVYKAQPLHDIFSHACDAFRYLCLSLPKTRDSMSADDLDKIRRDALYGSRADLPPMFRD